MSICLGRLRLSVAICCWAVVLALFVQIVVWALTSYTDMRWRNLSGPTQSPLIVVGGTVTEATPSVLDDTGEVQARRTVDPNRVLTKYDPIFAHSARLARAVATAAVLALIALITLSVLLGAAAATDGIDRTVSAFAWAVVLALMITPLGVAIGAWDEGAMWSYAALVARVDAADSDIALGFTGGLHELVFIARFLFLPIACVVAAILCGLRFVSGVKAALLQREDLGLDRVLEREAANIKASSLHGGRGAAAMSRLVDPPPARPDEKPRASAKTPPQPAPPQRLI
ncbi:MAG: hypothetical protein HKO59_02570 [Phycisphaerales bacterium]|nr:hypothetical protein [Phycisphaerae bacterium]NNF44771.1 hypothetical protein [Phycisphaerales bacterium]NNM24865.1 hypothetical protein [Phycisphaerales bacterium]